MVSHSSLGEYEETISRSFTRSANLRGLLTKTNCPQAIKQCQPMFQKLLNPQVRDTLITDMLSLSTALQDTENAVAVDSSNECNSHPIPQSIYEALVTSLRITPPRYADFLSHLTIGGITYTVSSKHLGNSHVLLALNESEDLVPARIDHILQLRIGDAVKTLIVVRRHERSQVPCDPFLRYPIVRAKMWSTQLKEFEIVAIDAIRSHYAASHITWDGIPVTVVTSLSRVSILRYFVSDDLKAQILSHRCTNRSVC